MRIKRGRIPGFFRFAIVSLFFILSLGPGIGAVDFNDTLAPDALADRLVSSMTDQEALAQTFMMGWVGADPSPLILRWVRERKIGGVKIFGWNTEDTLRLAKAVGALQSAALEDGYKIPLLIATDQEGGWIRHVKGRTSETPGNMAIGASSYPQDAYLSGYYIGKELSVLGINMNFAPEVDLYTNRESQLIGPRAFGDDPVKTGTLGIAFARGLAKAGIIATAKHYPGHGDTDLDSHGVLPRIYQNFDTLWNRELVPYRMLAKDGIPAIMSGHLAFPMTAGGEEPASLSSYFLTDILRKKIGFQGLIITDDLMMNGAALSAGSVSRAAKLALEAGNDIILFSKTPLLDDVLWTSLVQEMDRRPSFKNQVREAAKRVILLKLRYLRGKNAPTLAPDPEEIQKFVPNPEGTKFFLDLAVRSITVLKSDTEGDGKTKTIPLKADRAGRILLAGQFEEFFSAGRSAYGQTESVRFSYDGQNAKAQERENLVRLARQADTVIFCLANSYSLELLQALRPLQKRVIVVSVLTPIFLEKAPWVSGAIALYSYSKESFIAGFSLLSGRIEGQGTLPFPLFARSGTPKSTP